MELDVEAFAARILRPDRPKLAEVLAVLTADEPRAVRSALDQSAVVTEAGLQIDGGTLLRWVYTDASEAWSALAAGGVIPASWVGDPARGFLRDCPHCQGIGVRPFDPDAQDPGPPCADCAAIGSLVDDVPTTLATCIALGADPTGVARAEAIAKGYPHRFRPKLGPPLPRSARVAWTIRPDGQELERARRDAIACFARTGWRGDPARLELFATGYDVLWFHPTHAALVAPRVGR